MDQNQKTIEDGANTEAPAPVNPFAELISAARDAVAAQRASRIADMATRLACSTIEIEGVERTDAEEADRIATFAVQVAERILSKAGVK